MHDLIMFSLLCIQTFRVYFEFLISSVIDKSYYAVWIKLDKLEEAKY